MDLDERDIAAVAVHIGWQAGPRLDGALPIIVRGDCVQLCGDEEPPLANAAGLVVIGFGPTADFAVSWVRYNLVRGDVATITRSRAILWRFPFPFHVAFTTDEPCWLVHVDPASDVVGDRRSDAYLSAPFMRLDDPEADQPIFGPGGSARILRVPRETGTCPL